MEPIAITGLGCKLPGDIESPEALWEALRSGRDLITDVPADRWNVEEYFHPEQGVPGRTYARRGAFVHGPELFDAAFFGITPREANRMDPQQRWLLETTWRAIEDAGYPLNKLTGTDVGVFVGVFSSDWGDIQKYGRFEVDAHNTAGSALSLISNRVSYVFDFRGPSLSVDTACSSSLVALDLACQAIWRGEVPLAVAGGVNLMLMPDLYISFSKATLLSPDGACKAFDARANGYVRGEGAVSVLLKPLSAALRDGDRVYAVIRATLVNQDGRGSGLTMPNLHQQAIMLAQAYARADVPPHAVGYVEAHGTGTAVGDPIEANAIGQVLGKGRSIDRPLWIGSIKTNLGHLEPGSGVAGLAKLALALHHRTIPPSLHFESPNPRIPFDEFRMRVPTRAMRWDPEPGQELLFGGVNSFGFGGTNAHAVLSTVPVPATPAKVSAPSANGIAHAPESAPAVWVASARSLEALTEVARNDADLLATAGPRFTHLAAATQQRRSHHPHRLAVVADHAPQAAERLRSWAQTQQAPEGLWSRQAEFAPGQVAFVFSGQGTQWPGMARDLYEQEPGFRASIEEMDALMRPDWGRSLIDQLDKADDSIYRVETGLPLIFAIQVGLARLVESWGIVPTLVFGHSLGEAAAAAISGGLPLAEAVKLIIRRSRTQEQTRGMGTIAAVALSPDDVRIRLGARADRVHVAAINSATQVTLVGNAADLNEFAAELTAAGIFARVLPVEYPVHSPALDPLEASFREAIAGLQPAPTRLLFLSTVTGKIEPGEALGSDHWWRNLRQPVQFRAAVQEAVRRGVRLFVEMGPHPALGRYIREIVSGEGATCEVVGTLRRQVSGAACLRETLAQLHVLGAKVAWEEVSGAAAHQLLPRHPWHRQAFWAETSSCRHDRLTPPTHPLLGQRLHGAGMGWESSVSVEAHAYLAEHGLDGNAVFPAAGYVELLLTAAADGQQRPVEIADVHFDRMLTLDQPQMVQTTHDPASRRTVVTVKAPGGVWNVHARARGQVTDLPARRQSKPPTGEGVPVDVAALYQRFERAGHHYGPAFRGIRSAVRHGGSLWGRVSLDPELHDSTSRYFIHPALLDSSLQLALAAVPVDAEQDTMYLPISIDRVHWFRPAGSEVICHVRNVFIQDTRLYGDMELYTPEGELVMLFEKTCCARWQQRFKLGQGAGLYRETWKPAPALVPAEANASGKPWFVCGPHAQASELAQKLKERGAVVQQGSALDDAERAAFVTRAREAGEGTVVYWAATTDDEPSTALALSDVEALAPLAQALSGASGIGRLRLWLVTSGATWGQPGHEREAPSLRQAPLAGVLRTIATEIPHLDCRLVDLSPADPASHLEQVLSELRSEPVADEIAWRGQLRFACTLERQAPEDFQRRTLPRTRQEKAVFQLESTAPGSIERLAWAEAPVVELAAHEVEIEVRAAGLNFRDVLKSLDIYPLAPDEPRWFGDECAGVITRVGS
ncbi:MAG: acyltransferase domain-containing protein, partial [Gemmataceae bacterium]|nr:acyltransferase domain-containing protein [Gemmataceae bacterium]